MNGFRTLRADEIECRIAMVKVDTKTPSKSGVSVLLYKTARTDADLLDETVGPDKWQNDFKLIDGVLYGGSALTTGTASSGSGTQGPRATQKPRREGLPMLSNEPDSSTALGGSFIPHRSFGSTLPNWRS